MLGRIKKGESVILGSVTKSFEVSAIPKGGNLLNCKSVNLKGVSKWLLDGMNSC